MNQHIKEKLAELEERIRKLETRHGGLLDESDLLDKRPSMILKSDSQITKHYLDNGTISEQQRTNK